MFVFFVLCLRSKAGWCALQRESFLQTASLEWNGCEIFGRIFRGFQQSSIDWASTLVCVLILSHLNFQDYMQQQADSKKYRESIASSGESK